MLPCSLPAPLAGGAAPPSGSGLAQLPAFWAQASASRQALARALGRAAAASAAAAGQEQGTLALKEWAVTCAALGSGDQTFVLRKGGIREPTFRPAAREFLLFPTSFHSEAALLQPAAAAKYQQVLAWEPKNAAEVEVGLAARVTGAWACADARLLEALADLHIWAPAFLDARLRWRPSQPLTLLELRTARLAQPLRLPNSEALWGCFSWVSLPLCLPPSAWQAAAPALSDDEFGAAQARLRAALAGLGAQALDLPPDPR